MGTATKKTIFVVDDNDTFLAQFNAALRHYYEVLTMPSGKKMFTLLEKVTPHLIVLDIEMPEMDGFEILSKLKADKAYAHIPVMFLSSVQDPSMETKAFRMGIVDFIGKSFFSAPVLNNRIKLQLDVLELKNKPKKEDGAVKPDMKTIVAVDDNDTFLSKFNTAMKSYYNVVTASSGEKMFNLLEKVTPHLIVLDIEMPGMDGFEILNKLKAHSDYREIPVMFLSGTQDATMESRGFSLGIADFIEKDFFSAPILNNRIRLQLEMLDMKRRSKSAR